jgi:hypothetical protein
MTHARCLIPAAVLAATLGGTALAQTPIQPPRAPNMPAPESTIPEKIEPQEPSATGSTRPDAPLSDRLEATDGVIRPPSGIDPEITAPAPVPNPGTTPVIPPPGSPGGDPTIKPK